MTRIRVRRGTSAEWTAANPVLSEGEFGFELDTTRLKIGDGSTVWTSLTYTSLDWDTLENKPAVVAAGATQSAARAAISAEFTGNKGVANGYASLDANGHVPLSQWGDLAVDGGGADNTPTETLDGGTA